MSSPDEARHPCAGCKTSCTAWVTRRNCPGACTPSRTSPSRSRSSAFCRAASTRSVRRPRVQAEPPSASAGRSACSISGLFALGAGADRVRLSDGRRPLSLGLDPRQPLHRLALGLAQPSRPHHRARRHQRRHVLLLLRRLRSDVRHRGYADAPRAVRCRDHGAAGARQSLRHRPHDEAHRHFGLHHPARLGRACGCLPLLRAELGFLAAVHVLELHRHGRRERRLAERSLAFRWPSLVGLLLPIYTITGYDASAHTAEETVNAQMSVPKGMVSSVLWSGIFGYLFLCAFVLMIPNMDDAAKQGWNVFFWAMDQQVPARHQGSPLRHRSSSRSGCAVLRP